MWENVNVNKTVSRCDVLTYQVVVKNNEAYLIPVTQTVAKIAINSDKKSKEKLRNAFMKNIYSS